MPYDIAGIGEAATGGAIGTVMGLALEGHNDRRQLKQQGKLQAMQMQGSKEMAEFNRMQQMKMWEDTNYGAQMAQLKKAGLNPGLIYGMGGGGGATVNAAQAQGPSGGEAPRGGGEAMGLMQSTMATGAQTALIQAQKDLLEAQRKTEETKPANVTAGTENIKADTELKGIEAQIQGIQAKIAGRTEEDQVDIITGTAGKLAQEVRSMQRANMIGEAMANTTMDQMKADLIATLVGIANTKQDTKLKGAQTTTEHEKPYILREEGKAIGKKLLQENDRIILEGRRITAHEIETISGGKDFSQDMLNAIQTILLMKAATGGGKPTPIKGFKTTGKQTPVQGFKGGW